MKKLNRRRVDVICLMLHLKLVKFLGKYAYLSYWHFLLFGGKRDVDFSQFYLTALPNPGAGIGHQMANYIAGIWFAKSFNMKHAHLPFYRGTWETFLGFGEKKEDVRTLKHQGWRIRRIPMFDESKSSTIKFVKNIISSYDRHKIIFLCEQDQFYKDQYGVIQEIQNRFYSASSRNNDILKYDSLYFNIAIHVRRGDIMTDENNANLKMRIQSNEYFVKVLDQVVSHYQQHKKPISIFLFSQGKESDFQEFSMFNNVHFCMNMNAQDSFLHMVYADVLITSKSSFSYKPALLNKGIKICPIDFWHGYPKTEDWIMVSNQGDVNFNDE